MGEEVEKVGDVGWCGVEMGGGAEWRRGEGKKKGVRGVLCRSVGEKGVPWRVVGCRNQTVAF